MKTYLKGIKTVAVIFLSFALFSCQESLIEQEDFLLSDTKQDLSKKKSIEYSGNFTKEGTIGDGDSFCISNFPGTSSSASFSIQWPPCRPPAICDAVFNLKFTTKTGVYTPNYNVQISLFKKAGKIYGFQMWLHDGEYRFATDKTSLNPVIDFPDATPDVKIVIKEYVGLYRFDNGSVKNEKHREHVGDIYIGTLEYTQIKD